MNVIKSYKSNTHGNVAMMFAISLFVILLLISVALTTTQSHGTHEKLTNAADAAVLAAIKAVSDEIGVLEEGDWEAAGQSIGRKVFEDNIVGIENIGQVDYDLVLTLGSNNRDVTGDFTFTTKSTAFLPGILGQDDVTVSNTVSATKTLYKYSRINFLIDVSSSMAVGADTVNQQLLQSEIGCAIACHKSGTLTIARNQGIRLRIDTIKDALKAMLSELNVAQGRNNEFQVAIYTFSNSVEELQGPTSNLVDAISAADSIEISSAIGQGGTNISHSLTQLNSMVPVGKGGTRARWRKSYFVIMTDGVENSAQFDGTNFIKDPNFQPASPTNIFSSHEQIQGFDPYLCQALKNNNHVIAFLNPSYLLPIDRGTAKHKEKFSYIEDILMSDIEQNAETCSTSIGYAYSAETEAEVERATLELFNDLLGRSPRLSN